MNRPGRGAPFGVDNSRSAGSAHQHDLAHRPAGHGLDAGQRSALPRPAAAVVAHMGEDLTQTSDRATWRALSLTIAPCRSGRLGAQDREGNALTARRQPRLAPAADPSQVDCASGHFGGVQIAWREPGLSSKLILLILTSPPGAHSPTAAVGHTDKRTCDAGKQDGCWRSPAS